MFSSKWFASPFGMLMEGRKYAAASSYRYGFNGKENDNEVKGEGNQQDYGFRIYDTRLGKFLSVDPLAPDYPELTPYQFASNRPIDGIDLDGLEFTPYPKQSSPFSLTTNAFSKTLQGTVLDKTLRGAASGMKKSEHKTWYAITHPIETLENAWNSFSILCDITFGNFEGKNDQLAHDVIQSRINNFNEKVINGNAFTRAEYFSEFGTDLVTAALLDKGLGKLSTLKVFTNTGKTFQSASIRFTQNTVNDFATSLKRVGSGKYDPIDIVKMSDGMYSTVDNTRLLAAQKLGVNIKANLHQYGDKLPESMLNRFKNNATGEYANTWGEAIEYRSANQTSNFAQQYGSNGTFVQPEIRSQ